MYRQVRRVWLPSIYENVLLTLTIFRFNMTVFNYIALRIFDFLLSRTNVDADKVGQAGQTAERPSPRQAATVDGMLDGSGGFGSTDFSIFAHGTGELDPWMPFDMGMANDVNDFLLMPSFFAPNG